MNKVLLSLIMLGLVGCAEKNEYEQAIVEQMQLEKDIKDYKIEPVEMAKCVVSKSSEKMPGLLPFDPQRVGAYRNYVKMLQLNKSADPKKTLDELRVDFGSPKGLADAHANYAESVMECMSGLVTSEEEKMQAVIESQATK